MDVLATDQGTYTRVHIKSMAVNKMEGEADDFEEWVLRLLERTALIL